MSAFHQMGHDSWNLVANNQLSGYKGIILSPINASPDKTKEKLSESHFKHLIKVFDPQVYTPLSSAARMIGWNYFPDDFSTLSTFGSGLQSNLSAKLLDCCEELDVDIIASPAFMPKAFHLDYYDAMCSIADDLQANASDRHMDVALTLIVSKADLEAGGSVDAIASIVSKYTFGMVYLLFLEGSEARRELRGIETLQKIMRLISLLENSGKKVIVGYCGSELVLWKAAGATSCATGKFWNLRRFGLERFASEQGGGGGQNAYVFASFLLSFLRESDITKLVNSGLMTWGQVCGPLEKEIKQAINMSGGPKPWVAHGWVQYLEAFCRLESFTEKPGNSLKVVLTAQKNWKFIASSLPLTDPKNDGAWLDEWVEILKS